MSDILCVTNRKLCKKNFLVRIEEIARTSPKGIILREKDLPEEEYKKLAVDVMNICRRYGVPCILHSFVRTALELEAGAIHVPFPVLISMTEAEKKDLQMKMEIAEELGLLEKVEKMGWKGLTARESGKIGGIMGQRKIEERKKAIYNEEKISD